MAKKVTKKPDSSIARNKKARFDYAIEERFEAGLVLAGIALGLSMPGMSTTVANATDPADYGVAIGMRGTLTQVGVTAGLQTMVIALGTSAWGTRRRRTAVLIAQNPPTEAPRKARAAISAG